VSSNAPETITRASVPVPVTAGVEYPPVMPLARSVFQSSFPEAASKAARYDAAR
jgi:hypothetical protein